MKIKQSDLTDVFPPEVKPVHVGLYIAEAGTRVPEEYSYWNGKSWHVQGGNIREAMDRYHEGEVSAFQNRNWRGLKVKP